MPHLCFALPNEITYRKLVRNYETAHKCKCPYKEAIYTAIKFNNSLKCLQGNKIVLNKQLTENIPRELRSMTIRSGKNKGDFGNKKT